MTDLISGTLVTATEVKELIANETEMTDSMVNNFINAAHPIVSPISGLSADHKKQVELWLSAHFLTLVDMRAKQEAFSGDYSVTYLTGVLGESLNSTFYGQTALALDTTGTLQRSTLKRADLSVLSLLTNPD